MCLTERGTSTGEAMRVGGKILKVNIINIFSVMIGTGRLIHPSEIRGLTSGLQERVQTTHYHITTQFWALTSYAKTHHYLSALR